MNGILIEPPPIHNLGDGFVVVMPDGTRKQLTGDLADDPTIVSRVNGWLQLRSIVLAVRKLQVGIWCGSALLACVISQSSHRLSAFELGGVAAALISTQMIGVWAASRRLSRAF